MADKVTCPDCAFPVSKTNLSRHCRTVHGESSSLRSCRRVTSDGEPRSRSTSRDTAQSGTSPRATTSQGIVPVTVADRPHRTPSYLLMGAIRSLLEQHHLATEEEMCQFLRTNYSDIPEHELYPLVVGTIGGAQYAAHFHFIVERNKMSRDAAKREVAINAGSSLSFWNIGFGSPMRPAPAVTSSNDSTKAPQREVAPEMPTIVQPTDLQLPVSYAASCADYDILEAAVQGAEIRGDLVVQSAAKPTTPVSVLAVDPGSASSRTVEPYVPVALHASIASAVDYQPTPPAELRRVVPSSATQSQPVDLEPDLVIDADTEEFDASLNDDQARPSASPPKKSRQASATVVSAVVKPDVASGTRPKKIIDLQQYKKRRSEERPRAFHPWSRSPPSRRFTEPRWPRRGSSSRSPRTDRRDESPPRRLVLTGGELEEFLKIRDKMRREQQ